MNKVQAISDRILKSDNFENVAHVCCDWEEFVFEVAEWGVDHIATVDFDELTAAEVAELDTFIASFGCAPDAPHPCSKYADPIFAQGTAFISFKGEVFKPASWRAPAKGVRFDFRIIKEREAALDPKKATWTGGSLYYR